MKTIITIQAEQMKQNQFLDWERVFTACVGEKIAGYCTLTAKDEIPENTTLFPSSVLCLWTKHFGETVSPKN